MRLHYFHTAEPTADALGGTRTAVVGPLDDRHHAWVLAIFLSACFADAPTRPNPAMGTGHPPRHRPLPLGQQLRQWPPAPGATRCPPCPFSSPIAPGCAGASCRRPPCTFASAVPSPARARPRPPPSCQRTQPRRTTRAAPRPARRHGARGARRRRREPPAEGRRTGRETRGWRRRRARRSCRRQSPPPRRAAAARPRRSAPAAP